MLNALSVLESRFTGGSNRMAILFSGSRGHTLGLDRDGFRTSNRNGRQRPAEWLKESGNRSALTKLLVKNDPDTRDGRDAFRRSRLLTRKRLDTIDTYVGRRLVAASKPLKPRPCDEYRDDFSTADTVEERPARHARKVSQLTALKDRIAQVKAEFADWLI